LDLAKPIAFSVHAREKMLDRGATEGEVMTAISVPAVRSRPARDGSCFGRISHLTTSGEGNGMPSGR